MVRQATTLCHSSLNRREQRMQTLTISLWRPLVTDKIFPTSWAIRQRLRASTQMIFEHYPEASSGPPPGKDRLRARYVGTQHFSRRGLTRSRTMTEFLHFFRLDIFQVHISP
mmetsp:Transcript_16949/g.27467  ORF Transcript_16949/g.27467 Transcript_16949/m.27467 type:complete len:112 (-) Transcript_16949:45-380(-)